MTSKNKFKKISFYSLGILFFLTIYFPVRAMTAADIEMFINLGIIPAQNADAARNFLNQKNTISNTPGSIIKNDQSSSKECLVINQNLVKGQSGSLVSALQRFLKAEGHLPASQEVTGFYGDTTVKAVTDFQVARGLIKTSAQIGAGAVGPITRTKIQEVSCAKLQEQPATQPVATSSIANVATTTKTVAGLRQSNTKQNTIVTSKPPQITLGFYERHKDTEKGELILRYDAVVKPKEIASYLEGIVLCNPIAVKITSNIIKGCGEIFEVNPLKDGKKSFSVSFKNSSRVDQPITFAVEAFNHLKESLGVVKEDTKIPAMKPILKLDLNNNSKTQYGANPIRSKNCTFNEQLDFLRYSMTPTDGSEPVSLPVCWPGELLCNQSNPPTFCKITDGPTSDDLCPLSQRFFEGRCVPRQ